MSQAPINGLFQDEVGLGVVGGRLYQGELQGIESARVAARIREYPDPEAAYREMTSTQALGRMGRPDEIGEETDRVADAFLAAEAVAVR